MHVDGSDAEFGGCGFQESDERLAPRVLSGARYEGHVAQASQVRPDRGSAHLHEVSLPARVMSCEASRLLGSRWLATRGTRIHFIRVTGSITHQHTEVLDGSFWNGSVSRKRRSSRGPSKGKAPLPHERHGLGERNVGAPLHEFFPDGLPTDPALQVAWAQIRRRGLAGAVLRGGPPYFRVIETPIEGTPIHVHEPDRKPHDADHFARGFNALGALGYTLLRGQRIVLPEQWQRSGDLYERYDRLVDEMGAARAKRVPEHSAAYVEGSRLLFWEALGLLLSVSEQLAVLVSAVNEWAGQGKDLGRAILEGEAQPHRVFANPSFASEAWWRRHLNLRRSYRNPPSLSGRQRELLRTLSDESLRLTMQGVTNLRGTWNEQLHRVAVRYKHSFTLISASHGVAWSNGERTLTGDLIAEIYASGGLLVADSPVRGGAPVQLAVEVTIGGMDILLTAVAEAIALTEALVFALVQGAEHGRDLVMPYHRASVNPGTVEEIYELYAMFAGMTQDQWSESVKDEEVKMRHRQAIRDAATGSRPQADEPVSPAQGGDEGDITDNGGL